MVDNDNFWGAIGSVALGIVGGYFLIEILNNLNKCKNCGNQIPPDHEYCPYCGAKK